ncbi:Oidioi.mRNA.OKI2018_I69.chr2.g5681.t1.cds [Oikopleura dioica]|uniref:Oidioi.mRNA.OKI2018_I69.chr2.g5681.t1.cds n=1 Tax=Oikopleura dioica TaxID=34765 RepID=A0ABN7T0L1_OIKDI|nr:Oidioi.mRNA.OKI2018_I69.chr2.g5681.t1.cds [Oikopleura dioica]
MNRIKKLYELYEKKENTPKREKILKEIAEHPKGNLLSQLVFERADGNVFASAKNQLLPMDDVDEYGPLDHLLEARDCMRILKLKAKEDYVVNLLKEDFRVKYGCEPSSLSDIARIFAEREIIEKESSIASRRAVFETEGIAKIGSNWIITRAVINGVEDELQGNAGVFVYKILRGNGILLERVEIPRPFIRNTMKRFLLEPFLIIFDGRERTYRVLNLLQPSDPPRTIRRNGRMMPAFNVDISIPCNYGSDLRLNGELRESVLFPIIYNPDEVSVCIECARIGTSSIDILWKETIILPEEYDVDQLIRSVTLLNNDNLMLNIEENYDENAITHGYLGYHIILSKRKVIRIDLPNISGSLDFGIVNGRLGLTIWNPLNNHEDSSDEDDSDVDYSSRDELDEENDTFERPGLVTFGVFSEKNKFEVVCFIKLSKNQDILIRRDMIVQNDNRERRRYCPRRLIRQLVDMDQKLPSLTKEINGVTVSKPFVQIGKLTIISSIHVL